MLNSLIARTIFMILEGAPFIEAVRWVTRRLPRNLQGYYIRRIACGILEGVVYVR